MTPSQRLPFLLVLAAALANGGCATVKRLLPWGGDGDERADATATTDSGATSTEAKPDVSAAAKTIGSTDSTGGAPASRDAAPAADAATSENLSRADAKLDLSVPAPSVPPSGISASGAAAVALPTPAMDMASSANAGADAGKAVGWAATLHDAIQRNWLRPSGPQIPVAFSCDVLVKLTRSGIVEDAQVSRSCGHASLDASVISAVQAASPLPLPADMDEFSDTLLLTFSP